MKKSYASKIYILCISHCLSSQPLNYSLIMMFLFICFCISYDVCIRIICGILHYSSMIIIFILMIAYLIIAAIYFTLIVCLSYYIVMVIILICYCYFILCTSPVNHLNHVACFKICHYFCTAI